MSPRNDIAIYSPFAFYFYEDPSSEAYRQARGGGGAELQTSLLAAALARDGFQVAHVVYPVEIEAPREDVTLEVVERAPRAARRDALGKLGETRDVWRALEQADARLYLFRTGLSGGIAAFVVGALLCALRRRRLVLAASNDLDFIFGRPERSRVTEALYRWALRRTTRVVVQSEQQLALAREALPPGVEATLIPSFAEPVEDAAGDTSGAFLWVGRIVEYKLPLRYLDLARALPAERFVMIAPRTGETSGELERRLHDEAEKVANLELMAHVRRERVLDLISRSVAVVSTSQHEGMPNVFLEAWARGVPVISLNFDPDGRIERERMGIFAHGSWERFVEAATTLAGDAALRTELGAAGRQYIERRHSPAAVGQRWAALLRDALSD
jgi:glycosyltransferase involved in cell wall biosynthesis